MWFNYPEFYEQIAAMPDMNRLVEVGCWKGDSISFLAQRLKQRGGPFQLWAVDIWEKWNYGNLPDIPTIYQTYNETLAAANVRDLIVDIKMESVAAARRFDDGSLDFVFIDANHAPQAALNDIREWRPKLRPHGILAGHDYSETVSGKPTDPDYENVCWAVKTARSENLIGDFSVLPNTVWMARL